MGSEEFKIQLEERWDKAASRYGRIGPPFFQTCAKQLVELTPLKSGNKVLDVATGTGFVALEAAPKVGVDGHVTGIDISGSVIEKAKENAKVCGLSNVDFIKMDAEKLEFPDNSFDVVTCGISLCCILPGQVKALKEMYRVLKIDGNLSLSDWNGAASSPGWATGSEILGERRNEIEVINKDTWEIMEKRVLFQARALEALLKEIKLRDVQITKKSIHFWYKDGQELLEYMLTSGDTNTILNSFSEKSRTEIKKETLLRFQALTTDEGILSTSHLLYAIGRK
jgi:ubiquinone/menaquinone biosynthesis C-methylase UbiE